MKSEDERGRSSDSSEVTNALSERTYGPSGNPERERESRRDARTVDAEQSRKPELAPPRKGRRHGGMSSTHEAQKPDAGKHGS